METNYRKEVKVRPSWVTVQGFGSIRGFAFSHAYYNDDYYIYTAGKPKLDEPVDCRVYPRQRGRPLLIKVYNCVLISKIITTPCKVEHLKEHLVFTLIKR